MVSDGLIVWSSLVLVGLGLACGCDGRARMDQELDAGSFDANALAMIEQRTGLAFPSGSQGLHMFYRGDTIDPSFVAKVAVPRISSDAMLKQIEQLPDRAGEVSGSLTEKVKWWNPLESTVVIKRRYLRDGNGVRVLLCREEEALVVYVEWIKM